MEGFGASSNEPVGYDEGRVARLRPIREAVERLPLPPLRSRKIGGILNALEMQIEDGGDSPEVNRLLLGALRAAIHHQVGVGHAQGALRAINAFEEAEARRREQLKPGISTKTPSSKERMGALILDGYKLLQSRRETEACDLWLEAWEFVKQIARPEWRTTEEFDQAYHGYWEYVFNWCQDLEAELGNAGLKDPIYHEHRLRYAREFLERFPGEDANHYVNFMRAQGEALWQLGRQAEAEEAYQSLVDRFPDEAWGYIGWADEYWLRKRWPEEHERAEAMEYEKAEAIMKQALVRSNLNDRADLLERLDELYAEWVKPEEQTAMAPQRTELAPPDVSTWLPGFRALVTPAPNSPAVVNKPARNAPCWCGSGKKYKKCHLQTDEEASRQ